MHISLKYFAAMHFLSNVLSKVKDKFHFNIKLKYEILMLSHKGNTIISKKNLIFYKLHLFNENIFRSYDILIMCCHIGDFIIQNIYHIYLNEKYTK